MFTELLAWTAAHQYPMTWRSCLCGIVRRCTLPVLSASRSATDTYAHACNCTQAMWACGEILTQSSERTDASSGLVHIPERRMPSRSSHYQTQHKVSTAVYKARTAHSLISPSRQLGL